MTDSLQKIIDDIRDTDLTLVDATLVIKAAIVYQWLERLKALQRQPVAWMTEDRVLIKNYFDDKTDRTNLIPLIRAD